MAMSIIISAPRPAPSFTPLFVAIDRGFLDEEQLDATIKYHVGVAGLVAGEVDFLGNDLGHVDFLNGANIRRICGHSNRGGEHVLVMRPELDSVEQLKEVTIGGEQNVIELGDILSHYGLNLKSSGITTTLIEGSHPRQFEALKRGIGDGAMLGTPWWIYAVKEGYKNMGSGAEYGPGLPTSGISVTAEKIAKNPKQVSGFVKAYVKSMQYCRENITETLETMLKYSGEWGVDNLETARMVYDSRVPYWSAEVDVEAVAKLLKQTSEELGKEPVPVENFLDLRFLEEALDERVKV